MKLSKNLIILLTMLLLSSISFAEDATIEMLNKLGKESMGFFQKNCENSSWRHCFLEGN